MAITGIVEEYHIKCAPKRVQTSTKSVGGGYGHFTVGKS